MTTEDPHKAVFLTTPSGGPGISAPGGTVWRGQGRQLFAYYALLFFFLVLGRELLIEVDARFDLSVFPKLAVGIKQALNDASEFDNVINTIYSLLYAFLFALPAAIVYRITKDEDEFDPALGQTIVLLAMVVTAVITVVSDDLARAFGLGAVVAAVRFRNSLNDAKDAVYVFLSIAIGMACGARLYSIALWTSVIMASTLYVFWRYRFGQLHDRMIASTPESGREKRERKEKGSKQNKWSAEENLLSPLTLSAEAQGRVERGLEQQHRLAHLAALAQEPGDKRLNAGLVVEALQVAPAQDHVEGVLAAGGGKWRLATVIARPGGAGTLEFVGRLSKSEAPAALVQTLVAGAQAAAIDTVEFRSLKGPAGLVGPADSQRTASPLVPEGGPSSGS